MSTQSNLVLLEEKLNAYSHALGIVLAGIGGLLLFKNDLESIPFMKGSIIAYTSSLLLLFTASTIYHAVQNPKLKRRLRVLDHISIYYLIAGTYTPVCLSVLLPSKGWLLFYLVWGIALFGTILKIFFTGKFEAFSLVLYGVMGWLIVIDLPYLLEHMSSSGLIYLTAGGAFYTIGIVFYSVKKIPYNHLIWHFFVLGGALNHWLLIESLS
ncbi:PAQR family membrane homeostasis protein TrhA [Flagellimonas halotolerans]|uniref:Hemolysin III family protein n=1 Tax=Flagellimonas halotolerans TaxID=3112164 RepID=A0ABU6ISB7_9FLAO|nr:MULTISPECIES: hemolysin III family protein [unclassified Allomuricauda]MEC3966089.1 hemolysin III family protein [Muricauda sp. SYSU M86414]MEC4265954.1 hemolysin III family protein [Muricauda sp. SYSU M84420]